MNQRLRSSLVSWLCVSSVVAPPAVAQAQLPAAAAPEPPAAAAPAAAPEPPAGGTSPLVERDARNLENPVLLAFTPIPGGLTAAEVAKRAVLESHSIEARNAELRAAAAKVDSAMYQFLPRLTLKASYTRLSRVESNMGGDINFVGSPLAGPLPADAPLVGFAFELPVTTDAYSLGATLGVPLSDYLLRLGDSIEATRQNQKAVELNIVAERAKVEGDARIAFFNWTKSLGQVAVTEKSIERVHARLKDVEVAFKVGSATRADVLRLQSLLASTEAGLEAARGFRELAAQQLAVIMADEQANYVLGEDVLRESKSAELLPLPELVAEAQRRRPELLALNYTVESMSSAEEVVRAGKLPRLDGFADYTYANPNSRYTFQEGWNGSWTAGLQLSWVVNDLLTNDASAREISAQRASIEATRRLVREGIRMEVATAYTEGRRAHAELDAARRASEASQSAYDTSVQLYRVGKATTAELIDAEAELVNTLLRMVSAQIDIRLAETKLAKAMGRDYSLTDRR